MIIVTGTKRSGTSMWMQILVAAGYPHIGEAFPRNWGETLRPANREGFWESTLRDGINFQTNPNPETGAYVRPDQVANHVVKVFIGGLVRTDLAYVGRVVATVRHWREHAASVRRLWALEDAAREQDPPPRLDPVAEWFARNFTLLADATLRGYPIRTSAYEDLLSNPRREVETMLSWLGGGDVDAAVAAVRPDLRTDATPPMDDHPHGTALDVLYEALQSGTPADASGREHLARAHAEIMPMVSAHEDALERFRASRPA